jgi:hypothetical protein
VLERAGTLHALDRGATAVRFFPTKTNISIVGFEVLMAVVIKSSVFRDVRPCSPVKLSRSSRGKCRLHIQG